MLKLRELKYQWRSVISLKNEHSTFNVTLLKRPCEMIPVYDDCDDDDDYDDDIHSFIHSIGVCRMLRFLAVLRSFFLSCLLYTISFHPFPPASFPSSLTAFLHLFLGLHISLVASKLIYNTFLGILLSFIICACPNQRNLFNLTVSGNIDNKIITE